MHVVWEMVRGWDWWRAEGDGAPQRSEIARQPDWTQSQDREGPTLPHWKPDFTSSILHLLCLLSPQCSQPYCFTSLLWGALLELSPSWHWDDGCVPPQPQMLLCGSHQRKSNTKQRFCCSWGWRNGCLVFTSFFLLTHWISILWIVSEST